jgi:hypothetical protein
VTSAARVRKRVLPWPRVAPGRAQPFPAEWPGMAGGRGAGVTGLLREPLTAEQMDLLRVIFDPFDASGDWPLWQFADLTLDQRSVDAAEVLASLPLAGSPEPRSQNYGLVWRSDSHLQPQPDSAVALTVAGLRHVSGSGPLLGAFLTTVRFLVEQQRNLVPSPAKVVEATVTSEAIEEELLTASIKGSSGPPVSSLMRKLRAVLGHEPLLNSAVHQPQPGVEQWTVRVPASLRRHRGVDSVEDYLDRVTELVAPAVPPSVPFSAGPLDIPNSADYLDAVWKSKTRSHLFVNLNPASVARLTQPCGSEDEFNSLMSALADVLGQVVTPGTARPTQGGALEAVRDYLAGALDTDAAERATAAVTTLIRLRRIRVSTQHGDARHKAVTELAEIGLPFPPANWPLAWTHIAVTAISALDVLREEVHAGLPQS